MPKNFDYYSNYYDLLYKEKNYESEISYIISLLKEHASHSVKSILDLGCGTGNHAKYLANEEYSVMGIDRSDKMIDIARLKHVNNKLLEFEVSDIRTFQHSQSEKFDSVISLFHVISYLNANDDLVAAFKTAKNHLKPGGIFIFDCWYGPAVLTDRPTVRFKQLEDDVIKVNRVSIPAMRFNENIVDVQFKVMVIDKSNNNVKEIDELHAMRYLFLPEIENMLDQAGLKLMQSFEWLKNEKPSENSWNVVCIAGLNDNKIVYSK